MSGKSRRLLMPGKRSCRNEIMKFHSASSMSGKSRRLLMPGKRSCRNEIMKFPEQYRFANAPLGYDTSEGQPFGAFRIPAKVSGRALFIIACDGEETGWEHVSVSLQE